MKSRAIVLAGLLLTALGAGAVETSSLDELPFAWTASGSCGDGSAGALETDLRAQADQLKRVSGEPGLGILRSLVRVPQGWFKLAWAKLGRLSESLERDAAAFQDIAPEIAREQARTLEAVREIQGAFSDMGGLLQAAANCLVRVSAEPPPRSQKAMLTSCHGMADKALRAYSKFQREIVQLARRQEETAARQKHTLLRQAADPALAGQRDRLLDGFKRVEAQERVFKELRLAAGRGPWEGLDRNEQRKAMAMAGELRRWRGRFLAETLSRPTSAYLETASDLGRLSLEVKVVVKDFDSGLDGWRQVRGDAPAGSVSLEDKPIAAAWGSHGILAALWELAALRRILVPSQARERDCAAGQAPR